MVLEPDLDLGGRESDDAGEVLPLGRGQVPLLAEAALQLVRLRLREQHAPLAFLLRGLGRVRGVPGPVVVRLDVLLDAVAVGVHRHVVVVPAAEVARRGGAAAAATQGVHPRRIGRVAGAARGVRGRRAGRQHAGGRRGGRVEGSHAVAVKGRAAAAAAGGWRSAVGTELLRRGNQTGPAQTCNTQHNTHF